MRLTFLLLFLGACGGGYPSDTGGDGGDPAGAAPGVYEYECDGDEVHIFDEVTLVPGEWVDVQMWREENWHAATFGVDTDLPAPDDVALWAVQTSVGLNADGHPLAICQTNYGVEMWAKYKLVVR